MDVVMPEVQRTVFERFLEKRPVKDDASAHYHFKAATRTLFFVDRHRGPTERSIVPIGKHVQYSDQTLYVIFYRLDPSAFAKHMLTFINQLFALAEGTPSRDRIVTAFELLNEDYWLEAELLTIFINSLLRIGSEPACMPVVENICRLLQCSQSDIPDRCLTIFENKDMQRYFTDTFKMRLLYGYFYGTVRSEIWMHAYKCLPDLMRIQDLAKDVVSSQYGEKAIEEFRSACNEGPLSVSSVVPGHFFLQYFWVLIVLVRLLRQAAVDGAFSKVSPLTDMLASLTTQFMQYKNPGPFVRTAIDHAKSVLLAIQSTPQLASFLSNLSNLQKGLYWKW